MTPSHPDTKDSRDPDDTDQGDDEDHKAQKDRKADEDDGASDGAREMDGEGEDLEDEVDVELVGEVLGGIEGLEKRELKNVRLLVLLIDHGRSVGDVVEFVYGKRSGEPGYRKLYMRVSRRLRALEREGLVSRALFGKERPYQITRLGRMNLSSALSIESSPRQKELSGAQAAWNRWYSATFLFTALALLGFVLSHPGSLAWVLLFAFFLLLGSSLTLVIVAFREVR